jgi:PIN domain nuclease of toxin-antitoxin system
VRLLLDTHVLLWFLAGDPSLSARSRAAIEEPSNELLLSVASLWEMAIKVSLGKLALPSDYTGFLTTQLAENDIEILGIGLAHTAMVVELPFHHRDPFDRMLIAQAMVERLTIVNQDRTFDAYPVTCIG